MAMGLLDDYSFVWSDPMALWLIVQPLATLLAVHVTDQRACGGVNVTVEPLLSECQSGPGCPGCRYRPLVVGLVGLSHQSRRDSPAGTRCPTSRTILFVSPMSSKTVGIDLCDRTELAIARKVQPSPR